jgi:shikimate dehydrogenase
LVGAAALGFGGVNLTIPLKEKALEIVEPDALARKIGAVNTVDLKGGMRGYNTDGIGAILALKDKGIEVRGKKVLLVGAGGAARAIAYEFAWEGARITIANRTIQKAVSLAGEVGGIGVGLDLLRELIQDSEILVNSTSVGMFPKINETIATAEIMNPGLVVLDIVYNPLETKLLQEAKRAGARAIDGVMMLVYQGAEAFRIWTGQNPPIKVMESAVREALKR